MLFDIMYIKSCVSLVLSLEYLFLFVSFINGINCFLKMIKFILIFLFVFLAVDFSWKLEILFLPQFWVFLVSCEYQNQTLYRNFHKKCMCSDYYENLQKRCLFVFSTSIKNWRIFTTRIIELSSTRFWDILGNQVGGKLLGINAGKCFLKLLRRLIISMTVIF